MRIATFNVQNLRLRRLGADWRLDGAYDADEAATDLGPSSAALARADRDLTARVIARAEADIVALQEVFDQATLDFFHDHELAPRGAVYPYRYCSEGNDGRSSDVAVLSRRPFDSVLSHARLAYADIGVSPPVGAAAADPVFRRDCLAVRFGPLWLFICHFKVQASGRRNAVVREAEARAVRYIVERNVEDPSKAPWMALGDFNAHDAQGEAHLASLTQNFAVDLGAHMPPAEAWTYYQAEEGRYTRPDRMLAGRGIAASAPGVAPAVLRFGMARSASAYSGERFASVGAHRPRASDHALLLLDL